MTSLATQLRARLSAWARLPLLHYAVGTFGGRAVSFALLPLVTAGLSPAAFAEVGLAEAVGTLCAALSGLGMAGAVSRLYFSESDPAAVVSIVGRIGLAGSLLVAPAAAAVVLFILTFSGRYGVPIWPHTVIAITTAVAVQYLQIPLTLQRVERKSLAFLVTSVTATILAAAASAAAALAYRTSAAVLASKALVALVVVTATLMWFAPRMRHPTPQSLATSTLRYALPLVPHQIVAYALSAGDRYILEWYRPSSELGEYTLAYSLAMAMPAVTSAVMLWWGPEFHRTAGSNAPAVARTTLKLAAVLCGISVFAALVGRQYVLAAFPVDYAAAAAYVGPIIAGYFFHGLFSLFHLSVLQAKRTDAIAKVTILAAIVNIALNLALVPTLGAEGSAWATLAGYVVEAAVVYELCRRYYPLAVAPWRLLCVVACILPAVLSSVLPESGWVGPALALAASFLGLYVAAFRFVEPVA